MARITFQGHAAPGIYARAFLEDRITEKHLENFRRELQKEPGLSSYPHPYLMPDFWQFPTVSMGLSPIMAIYQARFNRYLEDRNLVKTYDQKVWAFLGDGESDEPESFGAITLAAREQLDNLIFVINCNLQRLDGPVRGNGKIIQELEAAFREMKYLKERRRELGGQLPARFESVPVFRFPGREMYAEFFEGTADREVATTMVMVHLLGKLLSDKKIGKYIVPIVPDEARTFGMESLFRKIGIYSHVG